METVHMLRRVCYRRVSYMLQGSGLVWFGCVVYVAIYKSLFRDRQPIQRYIHPPSDSNTRETRELKLRLFLFKDLLVGIYKAAVRLFRLVGFWDLYCYYSTV